MVVVVVAGSWSWLLSLLWWSVHAVIVVDGVCSCSCGDCWRCLVADYESLACLKHEVGCLFRRVCYPYPG
jgi:hypothetical protein